jgi:hypothetical protein
MRSSGFVLFEFRGETQGKKISQVPERKPSILLLGGL